MNLHKHFLEFPLGNNSDQTNIRAGLTFRLLSFFKRFSKVINFIPGDFTACSCTATGGQHVFLWWNTFNVILKHGKALVKGSLRKPVLSSHFKRFAPAVTEHKSEQSTLKQQVWRYFTVPDSFQTVEIVCVNGVLNC